MSARALLPLSVTPCSWHRHFLPHSHTLVHLQVRRAAAKLMSVIAHQYPDAVADIYRRCSGELISRWVLLTLHWGVRTASLPPTSASGGVLQMQLCPMDLLAARRWALEPGSSSAACVCLLGLRQLPACCPEALLPALLQLSTWMALAALTPLICGIAMRRWVLIFGAARSRACPCRRFREREENVKGDVFAAFIVLARQMGAVSKRYRPEDPSKCVAPSTRVRPQSTCVTSICVAPSKCATSCICEAPSMFVTSCICVAPSKCEAQPWPGPHPGDGMARTFSVSITRSHVQLKDGPCGIAVRWLGVRAVGGAPALQLAAYRRCRVPYLDSWQEAPGRAFFESMPGCFWPQTWMSHSLPIAPAQVKATPANNLCR